MIFLSKQSAQITVFLSVILLALVLLAAVIVDLSRISAGRALVKKAVDSAARSALAQYSGRLNSEYGLFALAGNDAPALADEVEKYICKNLAIPTFEGEYGNRIDLYGFRVEEVNVTPLFNLSEDGVFKRGVLEYMKYRAPKELIEGFLSRLSVFGKAGRMSEAYKKKIGVDKLLGRMDKFQQSLKKKVDGDGTGPGKFVNGFNSAGAWTDGFNRFRNLYEELDTLKKNLADLEESISQTEASDREEEGADSGPDSLAEQRSSLLDSLDETEALLENSWQELRYGLTEDYRRVNGEAADEVAKVVEAGKKAEAALTGLESFISENFKADDDFSRDFVQTTGEEAKKTRSLILGGSKAEEILSGLASNTRVLDGLIGRLDQMKSEVDSSADPRSIYGFAQDVGELLGGYVNIGYSYEKPQKGEKKADPREGKREEAAGALLDRLLADKNYLEEGISQNDLPSVTKETSRDYIKEDEPYLRGIASGTGAKPVQGPEVAYRGDLSNVGGNADLFDEEGSFEENSLGFIGEIGKAVSCDPKLLRDNIYLNEYILGVFRSSVPTVEGPTGPADDKDFQGRSKKERDTFYEGEAEYILHGNPSEKTNVLMTRGQILLVRLGLNTLHVYTDAAKRQTAAGIAAAVAGWWTGGAGIPVLSNLIMCGWAMGESILDLRDLTEGKSVPLYKLRGDWKLDIGVGKSGPKTDSRLYFSYNDYLRLFLLVTREDKKLGRMEDIIQLNMGKNRGGFKMADCKTLIRVEAIVSMKYLFLNKGLVPVSVRTPEGRHKYSILVYEGY